MKKVYEVFKRSHSNEKYNEFIDSSRDREEAECIVSENMINVGYDISTYYVIEETVYDN